MLRILLAIAMLSGQGIASEDVRALSSEDVDSVIYEVGFSAYGEEYLLYLVGPRSPGSGDTLKLIPGVDLGQFADFDGLGSIGATSRHRDFENEIDVASLYKALSRDDVGISYYGDDAIEALAHRDDSELVRVINLNPNDSPNLGQLFVYRSTERSDELAFRLGHPLFHDFVELEEQEISDKRKESILAATLDALGVRKRDESDRDLEIVGQVRKKYRRLAYYGSFESDVAGHGDRIKSAILFENNEEAGLKLLAYDAESGRYEDAATIELTDDDGRSHRKREPILVFLDDGYATGNLTVEQGFQINLIGELLPDEGLGIADALGALAPREVSKLSFIATYFPEHGVAQERGTLAKQGDGIDLLAPRELEQVFRYELLADTETNDLMVEAMNAELKLNGSKHSLLDFFGGEKR